MAAKSELYHLVKDGLLEEARKFILRGEEIPVYETVEQEKVYMRLQILHITTGQKCGKVFRAKGHDSRWKPQTHNSACMILLSCLKRNILAWIVAETELQKMILFKAKEIPWHKCTVLVHEPELSGEQRYNCRVIRTNHPLVPEPLNESPELLIFRVSSVTGFHGFHCVIHTSDFDIINLELTEMCSTPECICSAVTGVCVNTKSRAPKRHGVMGRICCQKAFSAERVTLRLRDTATYLISEEVIRDMDHVVDTDRLRNTIRDIFSEYLRNGIPWSITGWIKNIPVADDDDVTVWDRSIHITSFRPVKVLANVLKYTADVQEMNDDVD